MSRYESDKRTGSAIIIDHKTDKVVQTFELEDYDGNVEKMHSACDNAKARLLIKERKKATQE
tara:strand:- start:37597 stop:37782 length:186 start_codon:yes stop_codon:yes gene_type:complete